MINEQKLYLLTLMSVAMIFMLVGIAGAAQFAYITNFNDNTVSVIDTANNTVTATLQVGLFPKGVSVTPDGTKVYVTSPHDDPGDFSVIDAATNKVIANVLVGESLYGVAVTSEGKNVYVVSGGSYNAPSNVSVINTTTNKVTTNITIGSSPFAFG